MAVHTVRATLLKSHPFRETSRILRFHTAENGMMAVVARGVRGGGRKTSSDPGLFSAGELSYVPRPSSDLQGFRGFHVDTPRTGLGAAPLRLAGASFAGELVLRHGGEGGGEEVHDALEIALDRIAEAEGAILPTVILQHAWRVVASLGYRPILEICTQCGADPADDIGRFDRQGGGILCAACSEGLSSETGPRLGPGARHQLTELLVGGAPESVPRVGTHLKLLHDFVASHGVDRGSLRSLPVLLALLPPAD